MPDQVLIQQAIAAIRQGRKAEARRLLIQALEQEPRHVQTWLWLTETFDTDQERLRCLQKVIEIDPNHVGAQRGVQVLQARLKAVAQEQIAAGDQAEIEDSGADAEAGDQAEIEKADADAEAGDEATQPELATNESQPAERNGLLQTLGRLVTDLRTDDAEERARIIGVLATIGQPAVKPLMATALQSKNKNRRRAAMAALGKIGDPSAAKTLSTLLRKEVDGDIRQAAAEALGNIGGALAVKALSAALQDRDEQVRQAAAAALVAVGQPALQALNASLQGQNPRVRQVAAEALVRMGGQSALEVLVPALRHWDNGVRRQAALALEVLGWQPGRDEDGAAYWIAQGQWEQCAEIGVLAVEALTASLQDLDGHVRQAAIKALEKIGDPRSVGPLVNALKDKEDDVRQAAVAVLVKIGQPAVEALVDGMKRWNSHQIRQRMAEVLDTLGWQPDTGETGATYWLAKAEWDKCIELGQVAVGPLIAAMRDQDSGIRWAAADTLSALGWRPAQDEIGATYWIAKTEWNRCPEIGPPAVEPLVAVLRDHEKWIQRGAIGALERIGTPDALAAVREWQTQRW